MDTSHLLRTAIIFLGVLVFSLTGCSPEKLPWVVWPITGYPLKLINHTPEYFSDRTVMLRSSPGSPRTRYELDDYNPDHSTDLFVLEVVTAGYGTVKPSDKVKAHIIVDGVKFTMNHVIQDGQGAGIWTFVHPPSDYKISSNGILYYFLVEQISGAGPHPIQQKLGSADEPFTVKLSPDH